MWNRTYGGTNHDSGECIILTSDGGYAITGWTESFGAGGRDYWLVKVDLSGNMQWNKTYGGANSDTVLRSVVQAGDGGYMMAGFTESFGAGSEDFWLVKTDLEGNMQWNKTFGASGHDRARCLILTSDGGYAIAGPTGSFGAGGEDFWLIKIAGEEIDANIDVDPDTLNLRSKGKGITCYIELPEGYDATDINASSILLNVTVPAEMHPASVEDKDGDGIPELMVKFSRAEVIGLILSSIDPSEFEYQKPPFFIERVLTVTGQLFNGTQFEGSDTIRVKFKYTITT